MSECRNESISLTYCLSTTTLDKEEAALEEKEECPMWVFGQFGVQDALDQFIVTGGPLASVMGHKEIVAKQDDGGKEVTDTGLIVVTFHQLAHTNALELEIKDHKTNSLNEFKKHFKLS